MAQIFSPGSNTLFRTVLALTPFLLVGALFGLYRFNYSAWQTQVGIPKDQPVPFSHQHHVAGLGIDCRYCHISVEKSAFAGMPSSAAKSGVSGSFAIQVGQQSAWRFFKRIYLGFLLQELKPSPPSEIAPH
jgi:hypothetical protein